MKRVVVTAGLVMLLACCHAGYTHEKIRMTRAIRDVRSAAKALERFRKQYGGYPRSATWPPVASELAREGFWPVGVASDPWGEHYEYHSLGPVSNGLSKSYELRSCGQDRRCNYMERSGPFDPRRYDLDVVIRNGNWISWPDSEFFRQRMHAD